jgi:hypothetical protein
MTYVGVGAGALKMTSNGAMAFGVDNADGSTERMRIDSSGNVGIGTDSPNRQLSIYGTNDGYMSFDGGRTGNHEFVVGSEASGFVIYDDTLDTYRFVIDQDSGNVGIGVSNPETSRLLVRGSTNDSTSQIFQAANLAGNTRYAIRPDGDNKWYKSDSSLSMTITSAGNVGIGTTSPSEKLTVNGNIESLDTFVLKNSGGHKYQQIFQNTNDFVIRYNNSSSWFERMRIESDGGIFFPALGGFSVSNSDVRYNATSDELYYQTSSKRYKSEITDLENSLDKVNNLRPVRFKDNLSQEYATGMIAEEVAEIIPEVVFTKPIDGFDEPQIEGINYSDIVPFLIKSIQELKAEIDILKTQIN